MGCGPRAHVSSPPGPGVARQSRNLICFPRHGKLHNGCKHLAGAAPGCRPCCTHLSGARLRRSSLAEWVPAQVGQHDAFCATGGIPKSIGDGSWGWRGHRYRRFADLQGWKVDRVSENEAEGGGYKECILQAPPPPLLYPHTPPPPPGLRPCCPPAPPGSHTIDLCWPGRLRHLLVSLSPLPACVRAGGRGGGRAATAQHSRCCSAAAASPCRAGSAGQGRPGVQPAEVGVGGAPGAAGARPPHPTSSEGNPAVLCRS